jgi:hypothetical protein
VKAITTRLRRLGQRLAPEPDLKVWETAMVLYERRRGGADAPKKLGNRSTDYHRIGRSAAQGTYPLRRRCASRARSGYEDKPVERE